MNRTWKALAREAGIAAEHIAIGVTALGKANYAQDAYYAQAFFALSTGFERATKLALVVDHAIDHKGNFPRQKMIRKYGHDLRTLLDQVAMIARRRHPSDALFGIPNTEIHNGIVSTLSDFAMNVTRYYNLDLVTGDNRVDPQNDPVRTWFERVTIPVISRHYRPHIRKRHEQNATLVSQMIEDHSTVHHHSELGDEIDSIYRAAIQTSVTEFSANYERMYVMQIARFIGIILCDMNNHDRSYPLQSLPEFHDFFGIYRNPDSYFRQRKTWSIY